MIGYVILILTFIIIQIWSWKQTQHWRNECAHFAQCWRDECKHFEQIYEELQRKKSKLIDLQQQLQNSPTSKNNMTSLTISQWQVIIHDLAISKGWYIGPRGIPELLCLLHSEVSEALEVYRNKTNDNLPPAFAEELADVFIRLADMAEYLKINLEEAIIAKNEYNKTRPFRHGNKQC